MTDIFEQTVNKAGKIVKHWWLLLVAGLLSAAMGITVFCFPLESYIALSIMFGIVMLVTGIVELVLAVTSRNYFMQRSYTVVGGILDLFIGILLCCRPGLTMAVLPIFLGVWMLYHSFMIIGLGGDLSTFRIGGSGWVIAGGIALLLLSVLVIINPFGVGTSTIVILTGSAFLLLGIWMCAISFKIRKIHTYFRLDR